MRCAVLGTPIAHSLSPVMHRAAYKQLGLDDWSYDAYEVAESELEAFLSGCDGTWGGLSLTMPLKREVVALADEVSEVAGMLGVANTVLFRAGRVIASNTDCPGVLAALAEREVGTPRTARILGAGATAASVAYALATNGVAHIDFVVRNPDRAGATVSIAESAGADVTVRDFDRPLIDVVDLLVSTVPEAAIRSVSHDLVDSARSVFDVIYDPWPTQLAFAAAEAGVRFVSGLDLLAHQAALQVEMMTGSSVEADVLREAALAELADR